MYSSFRSMCMYMAGLHESDRAIRLLLQMHELLGVRATALGHFCSLGAPSLDWILRSM